ncbi:hypothetical protein C0J50_4143 [Silurus asotus]|uniref:Ig-like domain-containing protein n=1 Tax=Silurus asotus TaxID=30991 RepID=A0AAD5FFJ2_SILAS|nr:hypothetical protein C0J50_4143 [Silurus asotus]
MLLLKHTETPSRNLGSRTRRLGDAKDAAAPSFMLQITHGIMGNPCSATHMTNICFHIVQGARLLALTQSAVPLHWVALSIPTGDGGDPDLLGKHSQLQGVSPAVLKGLVSTETMQTAAFLIVTFLLTANTSFALISVKTEQFVNAECGDKVMLTCSIEDNLSLKDYYWSKDLKELCSYKDTEKVLPGTKCEYVDDQKLVLTIYNVHPNNSAIYTCKVKADSDHGFNNSNLHVSGDITCSSSELRLVQHEVKGFFLPLKTR